MRVTGQKQRGRKAFGLRPGLPALSNHLPHPKSGANSAPSKRFTNSAKLFTQKPTPFFLASKQLRGRVWHKPKISDRLGSPYENAFALIEGLEKKPPPPRFHAYRVARRDRDHSNPCSDAAARIGRSQEPSATNG